MNLPGDGTPPEDGESFRVSSCSCPIGKLNLAGAVDDKVVLTTLFHILLSRIGREEQFLSAFITDEGEAREIQVSLDPSESFPTLLRETEKQISEAGFLSSPKIETAIAFDIPVESLDGFALVLMIRNGTDMECSVRTDRFSREMADEWLAIFATMIEQIARNPDAVTTGDLYQAMAPQQIERIRGWNRTATEYPRDAGVDQLFDEIAETHQARIALLHDGGEMTYRDLAILIDQFHGLLRKSAPRNGGSIGFFLDRSPERIAAMFAILKTGSSSVPIDPEYPEERISFILEDSEADIVITDRSLRDRLPATVKTVVLIDEEPPIADQNKKIYHNRGDSPAIVLYTSGSTGTPKGAVIPHRAITRLVRNTNFFEFDNSQTFLQASSVCFDTSLFEIFGALLNGGKLAIPPAGPLSIAALGEAIDRYKVDSLWLTSGLYQLMIEENPRALGGIRQLITGGDVISIPHTELLLQNFPDIKLINGYGPTENTTFSTYHRVQPEDIEKRSIPVGRSLSNSTTWIVDQNLVPVPPGIPGEACCGGDGLALEYLNRPELNREKFFTSRFSGERLYKTGDLCRFLPNGEIEFMGRMDLQLKIRGFRVEPGEIEAVLARHPKVGQCKVVPWHPGKGEKRIAAYLSPIGEANLVEVEIREFLADQLPNYMVPSAFVILNRLPVNTNGKIDTRLLPAPESVMTRSPRDTSTGKPETEWEQQLIHYWREILKVNSFGVDDDFFSLGGHSLAGMKLFSRIHREMGLALPLAVLFRAPTVRELARELENRNQEATIRGPGRLIKGQSGIAETTVLLRGRENDSTPPLFAIHGGDGGVFFYRNLAARLDIARPIYAFESDVLTSGDEIREEPVAETAARYIEEIHKIQGNDGPCYLCGYSFGGLVAYEMAVQLARAGREIAFLGLIDTINPAAGMKKRSLAERVSYNWTANGGNDAAFLEKIGRLGRRIGAGLGYRIRFDTEGMVARVLPLSRHTGRLRQLQLRLAHQRAHDNYDPPPYEGDLTLFRASDYRDKYDGGENYHWDKVVGGKIEVIDVPGNHVTLFSESNIEWIASALTRALEEK